MMTHQARFHFNDDQQVTVEVANGQTLLSAARAQNISLPASCEQGSCGACIGQCSKGEVNTPETAVALSDLDKSKGMLLTCQSTVSADVDIDFDFPLSLCQQDAGSSQPMTATVISFEKVSVNAMHVIIAVDSPKIIDFNPGQFIDIKVPGTESWRSYSIANLPNRENHFELILKLLPEQANGVMSQYLQERIFKGDELLISAPKGSFYLRQSNKPVLLLAGGTGISAIIAQLKQLVKDKFQHPVRLLYGANFANEFCLTEEIVALAETLPDFSYLPIVANPDNTWSGETGLITDLLTSNDCQFANADVYICGPEVMIKACKSWYGNHQAGTYNLFFESFVASNRDGQIAIQPKMKPSLIGADPKDKPEQRHAIVIGGSMAGMMAAKTLLKYVDKVTILEQDSHHPMDFCVIRNSTSQAYHAHHILQAGQKIITRLFPGYVDDFIKAGGRVVDSSKDFRFYQNNGWKMVFESGIDVCVARRSVIEGVMRQQIEKYDNIQYRYQASVEAFSYCQDENKINGVFIQEGGRPPAELTADIVIDASGKNSITTKQLPLLGFDKVTKTDTVLNVMYSTQLFHIPEHARDQAWQLMAIYNRRPYENNLGYAALYGEHKENMLITLIEFNQDKPARTYQDMLERSKQLGQPHIHELVSLAEPLEGVRHFRYPSMFRRHYEKMKHLPSGLLCVGDALASADPVSGAGMSKAALEVDILDKVLSKSTIEGPRLVSSYYQQVSKLLDDIWFVLNEQNYRFKWVAGKRPLLTPLINWYVDQVLDCAHYDSDLFKTFLHVYHLNRSYRTLFAPKVLFKVIKHSLCKSLYHKYNPAKQGEYRQPKIQL